MAAIAGIAAFIIALALSYQIFPNPGTGSMSYAGGRFVFTVAVTIVVSVIASNASKRQREEQERRNAEIERERELAEREAKRTRIQAALDREEARRSAVVAGAQTRVSHLRTLQHRREQDRRDSGYRDGRFAFGVVSHQLLADIVWEKLRTPFDQRDTITAEQMASLTGELYINAYRNQWGEFSLEGMQFATNIDALSMHLIDEEVDLTPIAGLTTLRRLEVRGSGVSSVDAFATLDGLQDLKLERLAKVNDFRPLAGLESLARLELASLSDDLDLDSIFDCISGLAGLTKLEVRDCRVSDFTAISNARQLRKLVLCSTGDIVGLSPLAKLTKLEKLHLENTHISASGKLGKLRKLKSLVLRDVSGVGNLEPLANLGGLKELELTAVRYDPYKYEMSSLDLGPLRQLKTLKKLKLSQGGTFSYFTNWNPISSLTSLVEIEVAETQDRDEAIDAISKIAGLQIIRISQVVMPHLAPLAALGQLRRLELHGQFLDGRPATLWDLEELSTLPRLQELVLDACEDSHLIHDIGGFKSLSYLELKDCRFEDEDLSPLANLTALETLVLRENSTPARDLSPIEQLPRLTSLTVVANYYQRPWDTSRLERLPGLAISTK